MKQSSLILRVELRSLLEGMEGTQAKRASKQEEAQAEVSEELPAEVEA